MRIRYCSNALLAEFLLYGTINWMCHYWDKLVFSIGSSKIAVLLTFKIDDVIRNYPQDQSFIFFIQRAFQNSIKTSIFYLSSSALAQALTPKI